MVKESFNFDGYRFIIIMIEMSHLVNVPRSKKTRLRKQIGFVQQEPILFNRTIAENITYGTGKFAFQHGSAVDKVYNNVSLS